MTVFFTIAGMLFCSILGAAFVVWCIFSIDEWYARRKWVRGENEILKDRVASLEASLDKIRALSTYDEEAAGHEEPTEDDMVEALCEIHEITHAAR